MVKLSKLDLLCQICNNILKDPIQLPCHCTICHAHLKTAKDGLISCETCGDEFAVNNIECKVNKLAKKVLDAEDHLSSEEKELKKEIHELMLSFQRLRHQLGQEQNKFELKSHDHFAEIKRKIDIQREQLKEKIEAIYLAMIRQVEQDEAFYKRKLEESRNIKEFDLSRVKESLDDEFRKIDLKIELVHQLKRENEANVNDLQARLEQLKLMSQQTEKCIKTLNGHTSQVSCLLLLKDGHLAIGSWDKTIKIWEKDSGQCI